MVCVTRHGLIPAGLSSTSVELKHDELHHDHGDVERLNSTSMELKSVDQRRGADVGRRLSSTNVELKLRASGRGVVGSEASVAPAWS